MSRSSYTIDKNDVESPPSIPAELGHDHPHSSVLIWHVPRDEPLNEHTWVGLPSKYKRKKKPSLPNHHVLAKIKICDNDDLNGH